MKSVDIILLACLVTAGCKNKNQQTQKDHQGHTMPSSGYATEGADYADSVNNGLIKKDTMKGSPHRIAMANIGKAHVHIEYSSPGVKDRVVWGGLVPFESVWVTGAHGATTVNFSRGVVIDGKPLEHGTYAFFTIPGRENWTVIFNTRSDQHLTDEYDEKEDIIRLTIKPELSETNVQRLTYLVSANTDTSGFITMQWEKILIRVPVVAPK